MANLFIIIFKFYGYCVIHNVTKFSKCDKTSHVTFVTKLYNIVEFLFFRKNV